MNLRQAAQQALEALEWAWGGNALTGKEMVAIAALRAALAEPDSDYERGFVDGMNLQTKGSVDKAVNRIAEPEQKGWFTIQEANEWAAKLPQTTHWEGCEAVHPECRKQEQEPVASLMTNIQSGDQKIVWNDDGFDRALWHETPLYTAPTPRKPLTDEEIEVTEQRVWSQTVDKGKTQGEYAMKFARAIERAHGIGEQT